METNTLTTETTKAIVLSCLTENGARDFKIFNDENTYLSYFVGVETKRLYLPKGKKWVVLGFPSELTEQQMESVVENVDKSGYGKLFPNYEDDEACLFMDASESFASLLKKMGALTENPYGEEPKQNEDRFLTKPHNLHMTDVWKKEYDQWQTAQQSVGSHLILVEYKK